MAKQTIGIGTVVNDGTGDPLRTAFGKVNDNFDEVYGSNGNTLALAGLTSAADKVPYFTGAGTAGVADFTAAGRALVDDADAAAQRTTLGLGTIATQAANSVSISGGTITGITDLVVADGGTGASTFTDGGVLIGNGTGAIQVTSAGTSGQVLTSNGAGVDPTFQAASGMVAPHVIATSTVSTFTGTDGAFRTFPLDTLDRNDGSHATLPGSNRLSLASGTWHIKARSCLRLPTGAVAYGLAQPRIYNVTDAVEIGPRGVNVLYGTGDYMAGNPEAEVVVTLAATKSLEFQAYIDNSSDSTWALVEAGGGTTGDIYVQWVCTKIS